MASVFLTSQEGFFPIIGREKTDWRVFVSSRKKEVKLIPVEERRSRNLTEKEDLIYTMFFLQQMCSVKNIFFKCVFEIVFYAKWHSLF